MFIPTTKNELKKLKWDHLDIILISGDTYIDSYYSGEALIGKWLIKNGYKVGIISQPNTENDSEITRLGEPKLFWGVTAGCVDSMVANYTSLKKKRRDDDFTPGGKNNRRPNRATIVYTNLIKRYFKDTVPIVLGGVEASLRRIVHYDYWTNKLRKSILFDAKADILVYGMAEKTILQLAETLKNSGDIKKIKGICYIGEKSDKHKEIPSFQEVKADKYKFIEMFNIFYENSDPKTAIGLQQKQDSRYLIQNPPNNYLSQEEIDKVYSLDFERDAHPYYKNKGKIKALDTIKFSITSHRGCYGECNFCSIAVHQGRTIRNRSEDSIIAEAKNFTLRKDFKGNISDIGGPTANMYKVDCIKKSDSGSCKDKRCLYPNRCNSLNISHRPQMELLKKLRKINGVKKIFISSGLRYDMIMEDKQNGEKYLEEILKYHTSGQMKIAPEHIEKNVLKQMGKPENKQLTKFKDRFYKLNQKLGKRQFLTYYFIAAHPGCSEKEMVKLKNMVSRELKINPEQVQIFTPTPSTYSTLMYYTEINPFTGEKIFVEKDDNRKKKQKMILQGRKRRK